MADITSPRLSEYLSLWFVGGDFFDLKDDICAHVIFRYVMITFLFTVKISHVITLGKPLGSIL